MHEERTGDGVVLEQMPRHRDLAEGLRTYLEVAGVSVRKLFTTDKTRKAITFHDLRATGLTWMAIRGDQPLRIMKRAGHESFATTQLYVREAEAIRDGFGEVFPPLTPLIEPSPTGDRSKIGPRRRDLERLKRGVSKRYVAGWTGLETPQILGFAGYRRGQARLRSPPRPLLTPRPSATRIPDSIAGQRPTPPTRLSSRSSVE